MDFLQGGLLDPQFLIIAAAFVVAGFVKGVTGMGLPPVAMGLMAVVVAPVQAAALVVVPSLASNVWQMSVGPGLGLAFRRYWSMLVLICVGCAMGIGVLAGSSAQLAVLGLGAVLFSYALLGLFKLTFSVPPHAERYASPLVGLLTGLLTGATGVSSVPSAPYMNSLGLHKDALMQGMGLVFTVGTLALAVGLAWHGKFQLHMVWASVLCVVPAFLGVYAGQKLRGRLSPEVFKKVFFAGLLLLGSYMMVRVLLA